jgi:hypothetical protein
VEEVVIFKFLFFFNAEAELAEMKEGLFKANQITHEKDNEIKSIKKAMTNTKKSI